MAPCANWDGALGIECEAETKGEEGRRLSAGKNNCDRPPKGRLYKSGVADALGGGAFSLGEKISWARGLGCSVVCGLEDDFGLAWAPIGSLCCDEVLEEDRMVHLSERNALVARERKEDLALD